jgi:hypothetical protein
MCASGGSSEPESPARGGHAGIKEVQRPRLASFAFALVSQLRLTHLACSLSHAPPLKRRGNQMPLAICQIYCVIRGETAACGGTMLLLRVVRSVHYTFEKLNFHLGAKRFIPIDRRV